MELIQTVLCGHSLAQGVPPAVDKPVLSLPGACRGRADAIRLDEELLSRNFLFLGCSGTGKTNAILLLLDRLFSTMGPEDVAVVFDAKRDFFNRFYTPERGDLVLSGSPALRDVTVNWNLFPELTAGGLDEELLIQSINENTKALFAGRGSTQQPFFVNAAQSIAASWLLAMLRSAKADPSFGDRECNNRTLRRYFDQAGAKQYSELASSYPDLGGITKYLGDGKNLQALGVMGELSSMVQELFQGVFARKGDFSIRQFIRQKGGRVLYIEYDLAVGEALAPIYSLLMDQAFKEALSQERTRGNVYLVVDELKLLPYIQHLDDAVNLGRSMGVKVIASLQSLSQLYALYGEHKGRAIATGFASLFAFRPNDAVSRDFVREHFGKNVVLEQLLGSRSPAPERREGWAVEDWDLSVLSKGDAVVGLAEAPPFSFHFDRFPERRARHVSLSP